MMPTEVVWLFGYLAVSLLLSFPAARVTVRRGFGRGMLAAALVGVTASVITIGGMALWTAYEQRDAAEMSLWPAAFGAAIFLGLMGLFWLPVQLVCILWANRRRFEQQRRQD